MAQAHELISKMHEAVSHETAHAELPNLISLLHNAFPHAGWTHFLGQWENIFFSLVAICLISMTAVRAARKKSMIPSGVQNFCEVLVEGIANFVTGILGERGMKHVPFLGTLFIYILLMNWSGLVPLMKSSTASWSTTVALALAVTAYVQFTGIKEQGPVHYLKHMAGNPANLFGLVLVPLMLVINLTIEFMAVPLSLSLRLFANVSSEDKLLFKFAELNILFKGLPFLLQLFANVLAIAFSVVQAFVFMLLSTVYISLILPHEEHGHDETVLHAH